MLQNLGTKAGPLIPGGDLQIAGNQDSPLGTIRTSEMMSYGSYSGADIKVIVHYPQNTQEIAELYAEQQTLEAEMLNVLYEIDRVAGDQNINAAPEELLAQIDIIDQELVRVNEALARRKSITSKTLGEIQTISWGIFREKAPVRTLGSVYPRSFTRGPRTISGSMIFTVFYEHALHELMELNLRYYSTGTTDFDRHHYTTMLADQLPPLDVSLVFANEYGAISHMGLWGLEFFQEGGTFSIQDIYSENTMQYVARDLDPMRTVAQREIDSHGVTNDWVDTASHMLARQERIGLRGHVIRRNPFI